MIFVEPASSFGAAYPFGPARLRHQLTDDPLFAIDRILELARRLPAASIEHNIAELAVGHDPAKMPANGLSPEETIRSIADCRSWLVLINAEQDQSYRALMERCLDEIAPFVAPKTGPTYKPASFLFVSSPGAVTPFHMDPEYNILFQIRGRKTFSVYPADYALVPPEQHEAYHALGRRNIGHRDEFEALAEPVDLAPGDALYVPLKAPHSVKVAGEVSISYSVTWRSKHSVAEARLHRANHFVRRLGLRPPLPGAAPARDAVKIFGERIYSKFASAKRT